MNSRQYYLNSQGKNTCVMQYEVPQTIYDMTKDSGKASKMIIPDIGDALAKKPSGEYTFDFICSLVAYKKRGNTRTRQFAPNDKLILPAHSVGNSKPIETTLGRLLFYKIIIEHSGLAEFIPFSQVNKELTAKKYDSVEEGITTLFSTGKIDTPVFKKFIDNRDWFGLQLHALTTVSFTEKTIKTPEPVKKLRDELFKKYEKEIAAGDLITANKIENELIAKMVEEIKDDPDCGYDIYASGARGSVNNHMKNMFIMRGGVFNPVTGKQDIMKTCFSEGLRKEDFTAASNSVVGGAYPKSVQTADSGYLAKQLMAAMQGEVIGEPGSTCGTTVTLSMKITNPGNFINRFINENGKVVLLNNDNIENYKGKIVKMYSPMFCKGVKGCICERCSGLQESRFIGLATSDIATKLTRLNMKMFHVTNIEFATIHPADILITHDGTKYFEEKDGKIIAATDVDIIVPDFHYANKLVEELGSTMRLFGTVPIVVGGNTIDTLNVPSWHTYQVYTSDAETVDLPGQGPTKCKIFHYPKGHEVCANMVVEDAANAQLFLSQIIYGKIPGTVPYDKAVALWERNQQLNSVNFGVASVTNEVVLAASYRYKADATKKFGMVYAKNPDKLTLYDYEMASFRRICQLSSTFAGITFECFDDMITSGVNKSRTNAEETYSPLEDLLKL